MYPILVTLILLLLTFFLSRAVPAQGQFNPALQDASLNNLVLPADYKTGKLGELGAVKIAGSGKQTMILISGWGFGAEVFDNFIKENRKKYTMYAVTPAGFGGTPAPPMPDVSVNYAALTWTRGIVDGVLGLIEKEKLNKPVIVAHFTTGSQVALDLALYHPDKIGKVIIMGGLPYRYYRPRQDTAWGREQKYTPEQRLKVLEVAFIPWFKTVTRKTWDAGNHRPVEYSADPAAGQKLFDLSAKVPVPVMVRYLLEFYAYDISAHYSEIKAPVLVLLPSFSESFFQETYDVFGAPSKRDWMKYYFLESWNSARESKNPLLEFQTIPNTHLFLWYDNPKDTYRAISDFVRKK
jgi:pimeloyl-ACP methyl ester carboxylesterase